MQIFGLELAKTTLQEAKLEIERNLPIRNWAKVYAQKDTHDGELSRPIGNLHYVAITGTFGIFHVEFLNQNGDKILVDTAIFSEQAETIAEMFPWKPARKSRVHKIPQPSPEDWDRLIERIDTIFKEKL